MDSSIDNTVASFRQCTRKPGFPYNLRKKVRFTFKPFFKFSAAFHAMLFFWKAIFLRTKSSGIFYIIGPHNIAVLVDMSLSSRIAFLTATFSGWKEKITNRCYSLITTSLWQNCHSLLVHISQRQLSHWELTVPKVISFSVVLFKIRLKYWNQKLFWNVTLSFSPWGIECHMFVS